LANILQLYKSAADHEKPSIVQELILFTREAVNTFQPDIVEEAATTIPKAQPVEQAPPATPTMDAADLTLLRRQRLQHVTQPISSRHLYQHQRIEYLDTSREIIFTVWKRVGQKAVKDNDIYVELRGGSDWIYGPQCARGCYV
jgi:Rps23 Pro-64 3,4-dihydroxylase Tpa1-like proline 4-hydroxylase